MSIAAVILFAQAATSSQPPPPVIRTIPQPVIVVPPPIMTVAPPPPPPAGAAVPSPKGNPGFWVTTSDYPAAALSRKQEGLVNFRLTISEAGAVTACEVTASSGSQLLDVSTCALIQMRARFNPGRDGKGRPQGGTYSSRVRWGIPAYETPDPGELVINGNGQPREFLVRWKFFVEPDGSVSDCVFETESTIESLVEPDGPCVPETPFKPFLDAAGKPVRKRVIYTMGAEIVDPPKP